MSARFFHASESSSSTTGVRSQVRDENAYVDVKHARHGQLLLVDNPSAIIHSQGPLPITHGLYVRQQPSSASPPLSPHRSISLTRRTSSKDLRHHSSNITRLDAGLQQSYQGPDERPAIALFTPLNVKQSIGVPIAEREPTTRQSLLSPILLDLPTHKARVKPAAQPSEIAFQPGSAWEAKRRRTCSYSRYQSQDNNSRQIYSNDTGLIGNNSQPGTSTTTVFNRELYSIPSLTPCVESLQPEYPKRKLSYGEIRSTPEPRTLQKVAGSRHLRREAGWPVQRDDLIPLFERRATTLGETQPSAYRARPLDINPPRRKLRVVTDILEPGESIEEAHYTTFTNSSKAQVITISRRSSSPFPLQNHLDSEFKPRLSSCPFPVSSPETPTSTDKSSKRGCSADYSPSRSPTAPPNTPISKCCATECHLQDLFHSVSPASSHTHFEHVPIALVLTELELAVANSYKETLHLDSPVIQHARLSSLDKSRSSLRSRSPGFSPKVLQSRYSIFRPLTSHPMTPPTPEEICFPHSDPVPHKQLHQSLSETNPAFHALQTIFPTAATPTLKSLQATYLALNYLLSLSSQTPIHNNCASHIPKNQACFFNLANVPKKARAILGLQPPTMMPSSRIPWFRPQMPERLDEDGLGARVGCLAAKLRDMARDMLGDVCGRKLEIWDDGLVRAIGEVIRMGEERR